MTKRKVDQIIKGTPAQDGAGVKLVRVLGRGTVKDFDPFLMLDAFDSKNPQDYIKGFPWHPHRGIETVTYLIEGDVEHGDSLGNKGNINEGCCQWMTAGSGIIHQEMPQNKPSMLGFQLWINLPKKDKMAVPAYRDIRSENIPEVNDNGAKIRIVSGHYKNTKGATQGDYVKATILDISLKQDAVFEIETNKENTLFIYLLSGELFCGEDINEEIPARHAVLFTKGDSLLLSSGKQDCRFMFFEGKPLLEPVEWGGPIVMNTREELDKAFSELEEGTFIKHKHPNFEFNAG